MSLVLDQETCSCDCIYFSLRDLLFSYIISKHDSVIIPIDQCSSEGLVSGLYGRTDNTCNIP